MWLRYDRQMRIQNSGWKPSWKMSECETEKGWAANIMTDLSKKSYEHGRQLELPQNHVQWQAIVLVGLKFRVPIILLVNKFKLMTKSTAL